LSAPSLHFCGWTVPSEAVDKNHGLLVSQLYRHQAPISYESCACNAELPWCAQKKGCEYPRNALFSGIHGRICFLLSFPVSLCSGHSPTSGIYRSATGHTCALSTSFSNVQPPMQDPRCASLVSSSDRNRLDQQDPCQKTSPNNSRESNVLRGDIIQSALQLPFFLDRAS